MRHQHQLQTRHPSKEEVLAERICDQKADVKPERRQNAEMLARQTGLVSLLRFEAQAAPTSW